MTNEQLQFIDKLARACKENKHYNILPSLTIAQAIKESRWGKSELSAKYYNFFGMKWTKNCGCDYVTMKTKEWDGTKYVDVFAKFRKFNNFSEGIKGYYDFLKSYKKYSNLFGVTNSYQACVLIQKDGWASSPTYGDSLYNDYVLKYNLLKYDNDVSVADYIVGEKYKLNVNLYIRTCPNGVKIKYDSLCDGYAGNSKFDDFGDAILYAGCNVICRQVVAVENQIWMQISCGWICAVNDDKIYIGG